MARKNTRIPLNVYLNERLVGRLRRETSGAIDFQYDESWLNWKSTFPVSLSLPLREDRYVGDPVIAVFDNLLPDNDDIRRRVAARADADGIDPYSLLSAIGRDCVSALQFLPDGIDPGKAGAINSEPINDEDIAKRLSNLATAPLGMGEDKEFRISIAGAQDKTAFLQLDGHWHIPHGTTATTHILKPQIGQRDSYDLTRSVENEHICLEILRNLGLPVAKTEIVDFDETRALVIERFDRQWTRDARLLRVPQEDCCQALSIPPTRKYQRDGGPGVTDVFEFLKASDDPACDQLVFMKAQISFWLLGAIDLQTYWKRFQRDGRSPDDELLDTQGATITVIGMGRVGIGAYDEMRNLLGDDDQQVGVADDLERQFDNAGGKSRNLLQVEYVESNDIADGNIGTTPRSAR